MTLGQAHTYVSIYIWSYNLYIGMDAKKRFSLYKYRATSIVSTGSKIKKEIQILLNWIYDSWNIHIICELSLACFPIIRAVESFMANPCQDECQRMLIWRERCRHWCCSHGPHWNVLIRAGGSHLATVRLILHFTSCVLCSFAMPTLLNTILDTWMWTIHMYITCNTSWNMFFSNKV